MTSMSGAGRSGAAAVLEDLGWYVIDNLPTELVDTIVGILSNPERLDTMQAQSRSMRRIDAAETIDRELTLLTPEFAE